MRGRGQNEGGLLSKLRNKGKDTSLDLQGFLNISQEENSVQQFRDLELENVHTLLEELKEYKKDNSLNSTQEERLHELFLIAADEHLKEVNQSTPFSRNPGDAGLYFLHPLKTLFKLSSPQEDVKTWELGKRGINKDYIEKQFSKYDETLHVRHEPVWEKVQENWEQGDTSIDEIEFKSDARFVIGQEREQLKAEALQTAIDFHDYLDSDDSDSEKGLKLLESFAHSLSPIHRSYDTTMFYNPPEDTGLYWFTINNDLDSYNEYKKQFEGSEPPVNEFGYVQLRSLSDNNIVEILGNVTSIKKDKIYDKLRSLQKAAETN